MDSDAGGGEAVVEEAGAPTTDAGNAPDAAEPSTPMPQGVCPGNTMTLRRAEPCHGCLEQKCCSQLGACSGIATQGSKLGCDDYHICQHACGDDGGCRAACATSAAPGVVEAALAILECGTKECQNIPARGEDSPGGSCPVVRRADAGGGGPSDAGGGG